MVKLVDEDKVEGILELSEYQWGRLPEVEIEIDSWEHAEQVDFIEEWPLEEVRLKKLESYAKDGLLNDKQMARYEQLKRTVVKNRPIIRRLQNS